MRPKSPFLDHETESGRPGLRWTWRIAASLALAVVAVAAGCDQGAGAAQSDDPETVATVGGRELRRDTLLERSQSQLEGVELERVQCVASSEKKRHDVLEANLEGLVREQLVELAAAADGVPSEQWLQTARAASRAQVSDEEVGALIDGNPRLARANRDQIEPQVRDYLAEEALYEDLKQRFAVDYGLEPYRVEVEALGPSKGGGAAAPVTIVEFSDFQCPYCKRVVPALDQAVEKYGDKVRLVFRQFPLNSIHPEAQKAAEASLCAADQGKFWPLHDAMFQDQSKLAVADLESTAERLGLDTTEFARCVEEGDHADAVLADLRAGAAIGVSGTPALFINGRPMSGAVGFEALAEVIDDELERRGAE